MSNPVISSLDFLQGKTDLLYRLQVREQRDLALFTMTPEGKLLTWNKAVEEIFGYAEEEWIGQNAEMIFSEEDRTSRIVDSEMQVAAAQGRSADIRWHRRKDGTRIYLRGVMSALHDDSGTLIGFSKAVVDDTARKHLEDALTQSNIDLQEFAFAASHDLQEPLRTISIYAEVLTERYRGQLDTEANRILQAMVDATERMGTLIRDVLDYSQLALKENQVTSIFLDEDWESAVALLHSGIKQKGAVLTHDPLPQVKLDRSQLVRLFQNLIENSLKFSKRNEVPRIHASAERQGKEWIIRVTDNGIGFPANQAEAIFAPFKRLHSTRDYPGSGIGLAACKRIVERWGGRIGAESTLGEGASFWFTLPAE